MSEFDSVSKDMNKYNISEVWDIINSTAILRDEDGVNIENIDISLEDSINFINKPCSIVNIWNDDTFKQNKNILLNTDIIPEYVLRSSIDTLNNEAILAKEIGLNYLADRLNAISDTSKERFSHPFCADLVEDEGALQFTSVINGTVLCICPFTGKTLVSRHGFLIDSEKTRQIVIFYRFESKEVFYLIATGFGGRKNAIYFPKKSLVIGISNPSYNWGDATHHIPQFTSQILRNASKVKNYLKQNTKPAIVLGTMNNIGHYWWNEVSGISRFNQLGILGDTKNSIIYKDAYTDPMVVVDNAENWSVSKINNGDKLFEECLEKNLLPSRPIAMHISRETANKIVYGAKSKISNEAKEQIERAKSSNLIIFYNLRAHNKVWLEQVEGAKMIIDRANAKKLSLTLFLDGMSDCSSYVQQIKEYSGNNINIVDGTNITLDDSICWAEACDAFVTIIGSGLTFLTWLTAKIGVAHSETAHLGQIAWWSEIRKDAPTPLIPDSSQIKDTDNKAYCNYHIEPKIIVDLLWKQLTKIGKI